MGEPSEWAREAGAAVCCANPCRLVPTCVDGCRDEWCDTCLSNDAIRYEVARALDAAREQGRAESLAEALSTIRSHVGMDWDRFKGGDISEFIATKVEGEAAQFAAIRARGDA